MTNSGPPRSALCQGLVTGNPEAEAPDVFTAVFEYPGFLAQWTPAPWTQKGKPEMIAQELDRDSDTLHQQNFLDCIRTRQGPNCPIEIAAAVAGQHMANLAFREDRKVKA